jgi:hypothetical protein
MIKVVTAVATAIVVLADAACAQQQPAGPSGLQIAEACGGDIDRLCPGVPPGQGRIKACMKEHASQLSAPCFDALMAAAAAKREPPQ